MGEGIIRVDELQDTRHDHNRGVLLSVITALSSIKDSFFHTRAFLSMDIGEGSSSVSDGLELLTTSQPRQRSFSKVTHLFFREKFQEPFCLVFSTLNSDVQVPVVRGISSRLWLMP